MQWKPQQRVCEQTCVCVCVCVGGGGIILQQSKVKGALIQSNILKSTYVPLLAILLVWAQKNIFLNVYCCHAILSSVFISDNIREGLRAYNSEQTYPWGL